MFWRKNSSLIISVLVSLLCGALIFIYMFGIKIINPNYVDWIYYIQVDLYENYVGWIYYRQAPWTFPLGNFNSLSYPIETSVLNPSSIPLFAIFFKTLSPILPNTFQYFGIWGILCYMLQSLMGMIITRRFVKDNIWGNIISVLCGILFVLVPVYLILMFWHTAMACHWIILAAFIPAIYHDVLSLKQKIYIYSLIGFITGCIQPYLVIICGIICLLYSFYLYIKTKKIISFSISLMYIFSAAIAIFLIGAFSMNSYLTEENLFKDTFNLNGLINSYGYTSVFKGFSIVSDHQNLGYAYLGAGIIIIILIALVYFIKNINKEKIEEYIGKYKTEITLILLLLFVSIVLALSPSVTLGSNVLFEIPYPKLIIKIWSIFRCTGRFIWIYEYAVIIILFIYCIKNFLPKIFIIILLLCTGIQVYDLTPIIKNKGAIKKVAEYKNYFDNDLWNELVEKNNIRVIYFDNKLYKNMGKLKLIPYINEMAAWGYNKHLRFNNYYFSREIKGTDKIFFEKIKNPKESDLFIFYKPSHSKEIMEANNLKYFYQFDDFIITRSVPINGWKNILINKEDIDKQ